MCHAGGGPVPHGMCEAAVQHALVVASRTEVGNDERKLERAETAAAAVVRACETGAQRLARTVRLYKGRTSLSGCPRTFGLCVINAPCSQLNALKGEGCELNFWSD